MESSALDFTIFLFQLLKTSLDFVLDSPPPESSRGFCTLYEGPRGAPGSPFPGISLAMFGTWRVPLVRVNCALSLQSGSHLTRKMGGQVRRIRILIAMLSVCVVLCHTRSLAITPHR